MAYPETGTFLGWRESAEIVSQLNTQCEMWCTINIIMPRKLEPILKKNKIPALLLHYRRQINYIYVRRVFIHIISFILSALFYGIHKVCTTQKTGVPPVHDAQSL